MAGLKETPRQKMMGILYLVLLGIAATTVTDHVLDAFYNLTVSLRTSSEIVKATVDNTMSNFEATKLKNEPERAGPAWEKAQKIKASVAELDAFIVVIKDSLIKLGGGLDKEGDIANRADIDISPRMMMRKDKWAAKLKAKIEETRNKILQSLPTKDQTMKLALSAQDPPRRGGLLTSWEESNFGEGIPLTAAITALTKIQADMRNSESDAIKKILGEVDKAVINLDRFDAVAVAPTSYILTGQQYQAEVFLTASDSKANPEVSVGGQILKVADGKGLYTVTATKEGDFKWVGTVKIKSADGTMKEYKTKEQVYTVARPSAVVSPDKMNVFYIGVPNPVSVSAPGFSKDKIKVSVASGAASITGSNGAYVVDVKQVGKVVITVTGTLDGGKSTVLGSSEFRIKRIPPPRVKFGGKSGGRLSTGAMKAQNRIFAVLEDFDFDAPFSIQHFTLYVIKPRSEPLVFEANSNAFTPQMSAGMNGITSGSRVTIDNVFATGPDGMKRQLDPITFTVE
jgi:gliding motility-associated protein GldM